MKNKANLTLILIFFLLLSGKTAFSQTTIFNAPSTDVAAPESLYVEANFISHLDRYRNGGFQTFGLRGVYGLKRGLEVGANVFYTRNGSTSPVEIQPNFKWKAYESEKHKVAVSGGTILYVPLNRAAGNRPFAMVYSNVSKKVSTLNGLRLTAGGYGLVGASKASGTRGGVMVGFEQPVMKRVNFIGDWYSGKNRFGYASTGLSIVISPKQTLYAGYNFGNSGRANNSLSIYYGLTF